MNMTEQVDAIPVNPLVGNAITRSWRVFRFVTGERWRRIPIVLVWILISGALDSAAVALMAPFVALLIGLGNVPTMEMQSTLISGMSIQQFCALMIAVYVVKSLVTVGVQRAIADTTETIRADLMIRHLRALQQKSYAYHTSHSSAELINRNIWHIQAYSNNFVGAGLRLTADLVVAIAIGAIVGLASPMAALILFAVLAGVFALVLGLVRKRASEIALSNSKIQGRVMETVGQALGAYKEIRILGAEESFVRQLEQSTNQMVDAAKGTAIVSAIPRQAIEIAMVLFLSAIALIGTQLGSSGEELIPILGVVAAAAVRMMPATTSILANIGQIRASRFILAALAEELGDPVTTPPARQTRPIVFGSIDVEGISFTHQGRETPVLDNISFSITAGESVGIAGPSGAGKSTLVDLLLGFYSPDLGSIRINGNPIDETVAQWHRIAAYIPQATYILNDTIAANIALGVEENLIDRDKLGQAVRGACLDAFVDSLPEGLATRMGERGVRISGGQRQRIALARALYFDRQVLVMDEATSALDRETEEAVLSTVKALKGHQTLIIIAHRESSLAVCDRRITLTGDGKIQIHECSDGQRAEPT